MPRNHRTPIYLLANLVTCVVLGTSCLVACSKSWDLNDVKHWYDEPPENWDQCMDWARKATTANEPDKAVDLYKYAIEMIETEEGKNDMRAAQAAAALASLQQRRGIFRDAETYYKKAIPIFEANVGKSNPIVIENKRYLVECLKRLGQTEEASNLEKDLPKVQVRPTAKKSVPSKRKVTRKRRKQ